MKWPLLLLLSIGMAAANELTKERIWTGANGKNFRGFYIKTLEGGDKVVIASNRGETFTIAIKNLSEPDRELIAGGGKVEAPPRQELPAAGDPSLFKKLPPLDREFISKAPNLEQGFKWPNSITQSIGGFIYWWDSSQVLAIPSRGDAEKKCDWVADKLKRKVSPRNATLPDASEVMAGIAYYFDRELADVATYAFHLVIDPTPERMAEYTQAGDACFIRVSNDGWGIWFPVIDVKGDVVRVAHNGKILMLKRSAGDKAPNYNSLDENFIFPIPGKEPVTWNPYRELVEKYRRIPKDEMPEPPTTSVLEVLNKGDVPAHWGGDELIFKLYPRNPMIVCRPYVFADPEKTGPPPAEPGFGPPREAP